jgi:hypothetical protein
MTFYNADPCGGDPYCDPTSDADYQATHAGQSGSTVPPAPITYWIVAAMAAGMLFFALKPVRT